MGNADIITRFNRPLDEVISAIQKEIRRGNEDTAMAFCLELVPRFELYLWKRLLVIVMEDIGIAEVDLIVRVRALRDTYFEFREEGKSGSARLALANTVLMMCRATKSRLADHFQCSISSNLAHRGAPPIPDYALDRHTRRGRSIGRDVTHWLEEGCHLDGLDTYVSDPYKETAEAQWASGWRGEDWGKRKAKGRTVQDDSYEPEQVPMFE
jgi:hypothetical protein